MICKIQPANPGISNAVSYNEKKTADGDVLELFKENDNGYILATRNVPDNSTFEQELDRLAELAERKKHSGPALKNLTFHMSVNPSETDPKMSDEKATEFIDELMKELGYAGQPYRIYKHTDIEREHYHVVSTRAGQDGKKINDSFEIRNLRKALIKLAEKYGYTLRLNDKEKEKLSKGTKAAEPTTEEKKTETRKEENNYKSNTDPRYYRHKTIGGHYVSAKEQMKTAAEYCLGWNFTTPEQMQALLLYRCNVMAEYEEKLDGGFRTVFGGTDTRGKVVTPLFYEEELGISFTDRMLRKCKETDMSQKASQKKRLEGIILGAADLADSFDRFKELAAKKGVIVVMSFNEKDEPFGVTYIDRGTKCIWKGSETKATIGWMKDVAGRKGWTIEKDEIQKSLEKRSAMPSRKKSKPFITGATIRRSSETGTNSPKAPQKGGSKGFHASKNGGANPSDGTALRGTGYDELDEKLKREDEARMSRAEKQQDI